MFNLDREPLFSGQPMLLEDLNEEEVQRLDVENLSVLSIDQVREHFLMSNASYQHSKRLLTKRMI